MTELERLREKARHDEAQALYHVKREGKREERYGIARNALQMKLSTEEAVRLTGLTWEEVEQLRTTL